MTTYGILLVDTSWANHDSADIDKNTHLRYGDQLVKGAKALIYVREPIDALVAEVEIKDKVIETETESPEPYFNPAVEASLRLEHELDPIDAGSAPTTLANQELAKTYRVPLKLIRIKGQAAPILLSKLRTILGSDFSVYDETWIPLSEGQYGAITALWEKVEKS